MDKVFEGSCGEKTKFMVTGCEMCHRAWCLVHGISERCLTCVKKEVGKRQMLLEHGNMGIKKPFIRKDTAQTWMTKYFNLIGDKMPHNNQIHLPSWNTQKDIYQ